MRYNSSLLIEFKNELMSSPDFLILDCVNTKRTDVDQDAMLQFGYTAFFPLQYQVPHIVSLC